MKLSGLRDTLFSKVLLFINNVINSYFEIFIFILIMVFKNTLFMKSLQLNVFSFFGIFSSICILIGLVLILKRRARIVTLLILDIIISVFLISDAIYSRYNSGNVIVSSVFKQLGMVDSVSNGILSLLKFTDVFFVIDILLLIPLIIYLFAKGKLKESLGLRKRITSTLIALIIGITFLLITFSGANVSDNTTYGKDQLINKIGILNFHIYDIYSEIMNVSADKVQNKEPDKILEKLHIRNKIDNSKKLNFNGYSKGNNLIVIQVEALQNDMIGLKVNGKEVTPNLNKFVKRSMYFKNYYSETDIGTTSDAEFLSNESYYPRQEGSIYLNFGNNTFESLPRTMKNLGYNTVAMHANVGSYYNRDKMYPKIGFDKFYSKKDYVYDEPLGPFGVGDRSFLKQSFEKLMNEPQPFHAFIITVSSHFPYTAFENSKEFDVGNLEGTYFGKYVKAIHYADSALGEFFKELDDSGLMDKSTVVLYGDHWGIPNYEMQGDTPKSDKLHAAGYLGLPNNFYTRWMNMIKVPLIIHFPKDKYSGTRDTVAGQIDLFPTIANLFGTKPKYALGHDILNMKNELIIRKDGYITDGKTVYVKMTDKCYDIKTGKTVDKTPFLANIEKAKSEFDISDKVIKNNLIKYFISKDKN